MTYCCYLRIGYQGEASGPMFDTGLTPMLPIVGCPALNLAGAPETPEDNELGPLFTPDAPAMKEV